MKVGVQGGRGETPGTPWDPARPRIAGLSTPDGYRDAGMPTAGEETVAKELPEPGGEFRFQTRTGSQSPRHLTFSSPEASP